MTNIDSINQIKEQIDGLDKQIASLIKQQTNALNALIRNVQQLGVDLHKYGATETEKPKPAKLHRKLEPYRNKISCTKRLTTKWLLQIGCIWQPKEDRYRLLDQYYITYDLISGEFAFWLKSGVCIKLLTLQYECDLAHILAALKVDQSQIEAWYKRQTNE